MHPSSPFHVLIQDIFEGQRLTVIAYRDRRAFLAIEIGRILGYGQVGRDLVRQMNDEWAAEIRAPEHKAVLLGEELAAFKASPANLGGDSPQVDPRAPSVTLLTEQGLYRVLMLTGKPVGIRLRDWLDSDALPKIAATGGYGQPQIEGPAPEPKPAALSPVDVKLAIADRMLAANDKAHSVKLRYAGSMLPPKEEIEFFSEGLDERLMTATHWTHTLIRKRHALPTFAPSDERRIFQASILPDADEPPLRARGRR